MGRTLPCDQKGAQARADQSYEYTEQARQPRGIRTVQTHEEKYRGTQTLIGRHPKTSVTGISIRSVIFA